MPRPTTPAARGLACGLLALGLAACATDDVSGPVGAAAGSFTVDARSAWVYVSLADSAVITPAPSAQQSADWDIAFNATNITLNGGEAGPGGVTGFCVCQNSAANPTNPQWLAMTAEGEKADFDAVTSVPAGATFTADALTPALAGWFTGTGAAALPALDATYFVRLSDSSGVAKVRFVTFDGPTAANPGRISIEYAVAANGAAAFGATSTAIVDLRTGAKNVDLSTGQATTSATDWDLRLDGWTARVNGGISGPGKGAAAKVDVAFGAATPASTVANALRADVYAGVFNTSRFYKYNIGGDNRITPTFDVYLVKRGSTVYKLQVTNYYNATGTARYVTFRYARLDG